MHATYKMCVNWLFTILVRLMVNSRQFAVKFLGNPKLHGDFWLPLGASTPTPVSFRGQLHFIHFVCPCHIVVSDTEAFYCLPHYTVLEMHSPCMSLFLPPSFFPVAFGGMCTVTNFKMSSKCTSFANWPECIYLFIPDCWEILFWPPIVRGMCSPSFRLCIMMKARLRLYHTQMQTLPIKQAQKLSRSILWTS